MTDIPARTGLRWLTGILLLLTVGIVVWLGCSPTSFTLSNNVGDMPCRPVLTSTTNTGLIEDEEIPFQLVWDWLAETGYADSNGSFENEDVAAAHDRALQLCTDARVTRAGWMVLVGVVGFGVIGAVTLIATRPPRGSVRRA